MEPINVMGIVDRVRVLRTFYFYGPLRMTLWLIPLFFVPVLEMLWAPLRDYFLVWMALMLVVSMYCALFHRCLRKRVQACRYRVCPSCGYNLSASVAEGRCPECSFPYVQAEIERR